MTTQREGAKDDLGWVLDDLANRVPGIRHAIALSADGLLLGRSQQLSTADAEHLSAVSSALQSLALGTGRHFGGGAVRQTVVEMEHAYLFVIAAGSGACLAVLAEQNIDVGLVAYEMNLRVRQVGRSLSAPPRGDARDAVPPSSPAAAPS
ncbi:roadblock/LC7 domain-containing protein [Spiractinospora alimapuensis]|uniref:roadblock/LC7 domain-containing protein n=1 Tax=Spiractinospora alimapuensis TaxID=2820884 RepID=UPI001F356405|nr:roadblock/LC7 domain-containing protein [Spiractinospora alimapuensis]QVQ52085.1 roadblock/LC7 domain-containing protein [Spiractinospora alimapuensis]